MSPENHWLEDVFPIQIIHVSFPGCTILHLSPKNSLEHHRSLENQKTPYPNWANPARQSASSSKVVPGSWIGKLILEAKEKPCKLSAGVGEIGKFNVCI